MRILVTGGAGYLGSVLVGTLLADGHHVMVLDSFTHRENSLAHLCRCSGLQIIRGDVRDTKVVSEFAAEVDVVIPLAALVGAPLCAADPQTAMATNRIAIEALCEKVPDKLIIIPTTNSGYGIGEKGTECTEESPLRPVSLYGKTKVDAEKAVLARGNSVSLRFATLFGMSPRMRLDLLVNDFVHRALRDRCIVLFEADVKRNYLHVGDAAAAFLHVLDNWEQMKNGVYNVGLSDANLSKRQLCERISNHVDFQILEAPVGEDPDKRDYVISNAKIEATGFKPMFSLDDGIVELIKGFQMIRDSRYANV